LDTLAEKIVRHLVPNDPASGEAIPFIREQVERLQNTLEALGRGDISSAKAHLLALLA
jgi:hypothetical protein